MVTEVGSSQPADIIDSTSSTNQPPEPTLSAQATSDANTELSALVSNGAIDD